MESSAPTPVADLGRRAKAASRPLATASTAAKDEALRAAADLLEQRSGDVLAANAADVEAAAAGGMEAGPLDRLRLTEARLAGMAAGLRKVAALPDPVGEVLDGWRRPNGLEISRVRVPLGVVAIIYENRPNVTSDAGGLCLKSGNAALLRGSSTALRSNQAVAALLREGAAKAGLPEDAVILVDDVSHEAAVELMQLTGYVDCLIPRGGPSLVRSILDNAKVPYVIDGDGNCHVYVDAAADLDRALDIVLNAKTQRPSVCNAAESLLVHAAVADAFLPRAGAALRGAGVELVGDEAARRLVPGMGEATDDDFAREFLALKMSVAVVPDLEAAVEFMRLRESIDCLIPRGGPSLIAAVLEHATVPYVIDGDGNCHVYVDASADLEMALDIVVNAKTQRPSVCNAAESLVVHEAVADELLTRLVPALKGVELVGDARARAIVGADRMAQATADDFGREFLDLKLSVAVVPSLDAAVDHIRTYGSGHTEAIVTRDLASARRFTREVDAAAVVVNASTRFTDGEEFGFGAEIGISTQKLHARGPMGLRELTTVKYIVTGEGQVRT